VHLLATGGTISNLGGSDANRRTGAELVAGVPRIGEIADVTVEQVTNVASGALTHEIWRNLALRITDLQRAPNPPVGFIVTQGTDTMEETAFFLSLTVGGCSPVVVTGAMRQANWVGADGPANLLNSVRTAIAPASRGRGTVVVMNDEIFAARDVVKTNSTRPNAFSAPNDGVLGVADPDTLVYNRPAPDSTRGCPSPTFDPAALVAFPRVDVVYAHIGADSVAVDALVAAGAKGIVVAGVGRGGTTPAMGRALRRASERGVVVVTSTRSGSGRVGSEMSPDTLAALAPGRGARIGAADLNAQKARVLLMLGLATKMDPRALSLLFEPR
jgi:L-asparaginase